MDNSLIEFTTEWREVTTTCEPCSVCNEVIYGKQYQLFMAPGGATDTNLCEACKMAVNELDGEWDVNIS